MVCIILNTYFILTRDIKNYIKINLQNYFRCVVMNYCIMFLSLLSFVQHIAVCACISPDIYSTSLITAYRFSVSTLVLILLNHLFKILK